MIPHFNYTRRVQVKFRELLRQVPDDDLDVKTIETDEHCGLLYIGQVNDQKFRNGSEITTTNITFDTEHMCDWQDFNYRSYCS